MAKKVTQNETTPLRHFLFLNPAAKVGPMRCNRVAKK